MKIIETQSEFDLFLDNSKGYDWIIVPTYCNGEKPVYIDSIAVIYVYVLNLDEEYLIVFNHTEGLNLSDNLIKSFPTTNRIFVYGKKRFLKFFNKKLTNKFVI